MVSVNDEVSANAMGGTELMGQRLENSLDPDFLSQFQIIRSRVRDLDESKIRVLWLHDLPDDPESQHLANGGWKKFHKIVFVSNWQMQAYIAKYNIPWSHCVVMHNAITPIPEHEKPNDGIIRLAYWSTPHRGLNILVPVFDKLCEKYDNIELNVYSSFKLYGWPERDEAFKPLYEMCENHPKINYHGTVSNEVLREELTRNHIFAYPSTWVETSCLCLMEAMSAGMLCVHSNLGALYETAANWTSMYQFSENVNSHAGQFYTVLDTCIEMIGDPHVESQLASQKGYANVFYNWNHRAMQWKVLLESLLDLPREIPKSEPVFSYKTTL